MEDNKVISLDKAYLKQYIRDLSSTKALKWLAEDHYVDVVQRLNINHRNFAKALKNLLTYPPESRKVLVRDMEKLIDKI